MATTILVMSWLLIGLLMGLLARAASLAPPGWRPLALAMGAGLAGGLLGALLLGRLFSDATACWFAILAILLPTLLRRVRNRRTERAA